MATSYPVVHIWGVLPFRLAVRIIVDSTRPALRRSTTSCRIPGGNPSKSPEFEVTASVHLSYAFALACVRRAWPVEALMLRRQLLKTTPLAVAGAMAGGLSAPKTAAGQQTAPASATKRPIRIVMGGYSPSSTAFSLALKRIGDRLKARLGDEVDIKYVYNVLDLGYREDDLNWMVADGVLTLAYQSSGYFTPEVPDLGVADLPYLFPNVQAARAAIDGRFGRRSPPRSKQA